jgi:hypothetical protein
MVFVEDMEDLKDRGFGQEDLRELQEYAQETNLWGDVLSFGEDKALITVYGGIEEAVAKVREQGKLHGLDEGKVEEGQHMEVASVEDTGLYAVVEELVWKNKEKAYARYLLFEEVWTTDLEIGDSRLDYEVCMDDEGWYAYVSVDGQAWNAVGQSGSKAGAMSKVQEDVDERYGLAAAAVENSGRDDGQDNRQERGLVADATAANKAAKAEREASRDEQATLSGEVRNV